jgi:uncharacterized RmlC-like cupin family protein
MGSKIVVVKGGGNTLDTTQTQGSVRVEGIGPSTDADNVWMGRVRNQPGEWSLPHHHGVAETAGFVLAGRARIYFGEGYLEYVDLEAGDMVYVPPMLPHIEGNLSETEPLEFITARTPRNIVVNLEPLAHDHHRSFLSGQENSRSGTADTETRSPTDASTTAAAPPRAANV